MEPLSKTGAADKYQIYGEIGLKYGNQRKHGRLHKHRRLQLVIASGASRLRSRCAVVFF